MCTESAINLSGLATVNTRSRYYLTDVDPAAVPNETQDFLRCMIRQKKVIYDWGQHYLFSCSIPFEVSYVEGNVYCVGSNNIPIEDECFHGCEPETLHEALRIVFQGEWGPSAIDLIFRLENSGIRVELCNTAKFGPQNPGKFLEELRKNIVV